VCAGHAGLPDIGSWHLRTRIYAWTVRRHRKIVLFDTTPMCGFVRMLRYPSARLLPGRVPFGEASQFPSAPDLAITQNGDTASHCRPDFPFVY
jgi:hypothetical protein